MSGLTLADLTPGDHITFGGGLPGYAAQTFTVERVSGHGFTVQAANGAATFFTASPGLDLSDHYSLFRVQPWPMLCILYPLALRMVRDEGGTEHLEAAHGSRIPGVPADPVDQLVQSSPIFARVGEIGPGGAPMLSAYGSMITERALRDVIRASGWRLALFENERRVRAVIEVDRAGSSWKSAEGRGGCGAVAVGRALKLAAEVSRDGGNA